MKSFYYYLLLIFFHTVSFGQNLVPNGSFEEYKKCPNAISQFGYVFDWKSIGSNSTPDFFSYCTHYTNNCHPESSYYRVKPKDGYSYAGIVNLVRDKHDYREYIGVKLFSKLLEDTTYTFRISLAVPQLCPMLNHNFDILFTKELVKSRTNQVIDMIPSFRLIIDTMRTDGKWATYEFDFVAKGDERYVQLGNFKKKDTKWNYIDNRKKKTKKGSSYSIILMDDIQLIQKYSKKVEAAVKQEQDIVVQTKTFVFKDLKFKTNSSELILTNLHKLDSLATYLVENVQFSVTVKGHTDNQGDVEKNKVLSLERAKSVAEYLIYKGVSSHRISTLGFGSSIPIRENDTEGGRLENRRVEITLE